jgi:uncharacterized tellurite resistance protein B-like protein
MDRLLADIRQPATTSAAAARKIQLAAAVLLCSSLPSGDPLYALNTASLRHELGQLLALAPSKLDRLISRAAAAQESRPALLACADLLKRQSSIGFRQEIVAGAIRIGLADLTVNHFELDLIERLARLLNVSPAGERRAA